MCLHTIQKVPFIAEQDIIVYKVISKRNLSLIQLFQYIPNCTHKKVSIEPRNGYNGAPEYEISYGYHSFIDMPAALEEMKRVCGLIKISLKVVEFTIPKGTEYYKGRDDKGLPCYVSEVITSSNLEELNLKEIA